MPTKSPDPNDPLTLLEAAKNQFNPGQASKIQKLLGQISKLQLDPHQLIRFHEALLFLRAFPHAQSEIPRLENLLNTFHLRIEKLRAANAVMSLFDDFDTSGIAGTTMQDTLSFDVAQWLVDRIPKNVEIAWNNYWDDYQSERARGNTCIDGLNMLLHQGRMGFTAWFGRDVEVTEEQRQAVLAA